MAGPTKIETILNLKKQRFLKAFGETGQLTRSAELAKCHINSHYKWLRDDPDYPEAFREACKVAQATLEAEAIRRGRDGTDETVWHQGQPVGTVRKYSDTLLIFMLKGFDPDRYADRRYNEHKHSGSVDHRVSRRYDELQQIMADPDALALLEQLAGRVESGQ